MPPTFETVVTRQPKKSEYGKDEGAAKRSAGDGHDKDSDDDVTSKCDDFERHALEEGGGDNDNDDNHSVHYVEATAVRTLAANTGSVAILGTTAKCKSVDGSPSISRPSANRQSTWSPSRTAFAPVACSKSQPQLEVRYVEATAVRTLAADTGSIAILGTTADPRPWSADRNEDTGSVRYLGAETGSIGTLASTAAVAAKQAESAGRSDLDFIPVGVREVLDSEPGELQQREEDRPEGELAGQRDGLEKQPLIPLPVVYAMEMKPADEIFKTMKSIDRPQYSPESATIIVDDDDDEGATVSGSVSDAASRRPLIRQSNKTNDQTADNEDISLPDGWMPKVPVFAKCPPAKSKSKY